MATPDIPRSSSVPPPLPGEPSTLRVREPGELVAAVPVLLGFHPRASLVLVATGGESGRRLGLTLRVDLPLPEHVAAVAVDVVQSLLLDTPTGAAVIVVAESAEAARPHERLVGLVVHDLEAHGIDVHTVLSTPSTAAGARWACYDPCGCTGLVPEGSATPFAAAAVAAGRVVRSDRSDLEQLLAPAHPEHIRRREALLIGAADEALHHRPDPGAPHRTAADREGPGAELAFVDAAIADAAADRLILDDTRVVTLAALLAVPDVRDAALLRCVGPAAAAAEQLWTALVRETPDPEAAEPAALLAVSAMVRGDGALANIALDRAEQAWPGHRLTAILRSVLLGMRPEEIRDWVRRGGERAGVSSVPLPTSRRTIRRNRPGA
jgi:hypothetical protein